MSSKSVRKLEENSIQMRMLFAGNIVRQPCFDAMRANGKGYRIAGSLEETDIVMNDTFWLGVYPGISERAIEYIADVIGKYCYKMKAVGFRLLVSSFASYWDSRISLASSAAPTPVSEPGSDSSF